MPFCGNLRSGNNPDFFSGTKSEPFVILEFEIGARRWGTHRDEGSWRAMRQSSRSAPGPS